MTHLNYIIPNHPAKFLSSTSALENFFSSFQGNIIGLQQGFESPFGEKEIVYADWTASGRAYQPIEDCMQKSILPFVANTHTASTVPLKLMS